MGVEEAAGSQIQDLGLGQLGVEGEVEVVEGLARFEGGAREAQLKLLGLAALHLVGQQAVKELGGADVVVSGLPEPQVQRLEDAGEAQLLENGDQIVEGSHVSS